jgi:D-alanyl-D-alanine carboxypeptidase
VGKLRLHNHNSLLASYAGADGMKTGFICDSGFNVVASATRDGHKLIAVVLGAASGAERAERAANLLEHGFLTHGWKLMFATQTLNTMPMPEDAKGPTTMREAVQSYECGTRRAVAKAAKKGQSVAANGAKRTVRKAKAASTSQAPPAQQ